MAKIHRGDGGQTGQLAPPAAETEQTAALPPQNGQTKAMPKAQTAGQAAPAAPLYGEPTGFYDQDNDTEFDERQRKKRKRRRIDRLYTAAMVVFAALFLVSGGLLLKRFWDDRRVENEFSDLQAQIVETQADPSGDTAAQTADEQESSAAKFAALRAQNADFIGWLSIEGTNLDLPVMFAPDNVNFYLKHDFNKQYSDYGVPYLDEKTTLGANDMSENLIIYGHNMKTGTIFGCLTNYDSAAYYAEHPVIEFDTVYGDAQYRVFAAFAIDVVNDQSFLYNEYVDLDEDTFNAYVDELLRRSTVDTGLRPAYGERLLTLSTCEYSSENGRYVVAAYCENAEES